MLKVLHQIRPELLRGLPTPSASNVRSVDWITSLTILAGEELAQPLTGYNAHEDFVNQVSLWVLILSLLTLSQYAKSIASPESGPLTAEAVNSFFSYVFQNGLNAPFVSFDPCHGLLTSKVPINDHYFPPGRVGFQLSTFTGGLTPRLMPAPRLSPPFPNDQIFG